MAFPYNDQGELNLFGFTVAKKQKVETQINSFVPEANDTGGTEVSSYSGAAYNSFSIDIDPSVIKNENDLIHKYREMSLVADIDLAIGEIVDEFLVLNETDKAITLDFDEYFSDKYSEKTKKLIIEEFNTVINLLAFNQNGHDIFRNFYVDGRLAYHKLIDVNNTKAGISELRPINVAKLKRVVEIKKEKDPVTGATIIKGQSDYYVYAENGFNGDNKTGLKIAPEAIAYITSGLLDRNANTSISYLHKAIRPLNQLRMMEDSDVIYRMTRAPERRVFYIDTGGMARTKAEQYIKDVMARYKNKQVYDSVTGTLKDDKKHLCLPMYTKVPLLDGRTLTLSEIANEYKDKQLWAYSCDPLTGKFSPGLITWAGVSRPNAKIMRITLDNDKTVDCTPDHRFPTWFKGLTQAQDLVVGDSMMPFYTREYSVDKRKEKSAEYQQIWDNDLKKWVFTHRAVSIWKDSVGLANVYNFNENFKDCTAKTVHHIDINKNNNSPDNLTRMNSGDHASLHHHLGSVNGKKNGIKTRDLGLGYFNRNHPDYHTWHVNAGKSGGAVSAATGKSQENRALGRKVLAELFTNTEWNDWFRNQQTVGWTEEKRETASVHAKKRGLSSLGNETQAKLWKTKERLDKHKKEYVVEYNQFIFNIVETCAKNNKTVAGVLSELNSNESALTQWAQINSSKVISKKQKSFEYFISSDITKITKLYASVNYLALKNQFKYKNHKITKIEYIEETVDTGCLTIDGDEIYHRNHTFALDAGIYTENSILEDFWLPRSSGTGGGKGTEITTLGGSGTLGALENTEYFQTKLWQALGLPTSRMQTGQGSFNIGRGNEITRDEIKFAKFIAKLRRRFNLLFMDLLKTQLLLKGITTTEDWDAIKDNLVFKYGKDNFFAELKESDMFKERISNATAADPFVGKYFSQRHVMRDMLKMTDQQCTDMLDQIKQEIPTDPTAQPDQPPDNNTQQQQSDSAQ